MPSRIEDYALVGDCETAALISRDGSVDWLCWPRFDSDACFAALLSRERRGYWRLAPQGHYACTDWRYRPDTMLLETEFTAGGGRMRVLDFMPARSQHPTLVRQVVGVQGEVGCRM